MPDVEAELTKVFADIKPDLEPRPIFQQQVDPTALTNKRGKTHGNFGDTARISQEIKTLIRKELGYRSKRGQKLLTFKQIESLDMIALKMARILAGDPAFADHWDDIAGYAVLPNKDV